MTDLAHDQLVVDDARDDRHHPPDERRTTTVTTDIAERPCSRCGRARRDEDDRWMLLSHDIRADGIGGWFSLRTQHICHDCWRPFERQAIDDITEKIATCCSECDGSGRPNLTAGLSERGGFTKATVAAWGISWPLTSGWMARAYCPACKGTGRQANPGTTTASDQDSTEADDHPTAA